MPNGAMSVKITITLWLFADDGRNTLRSIELARSVSAGQSDWHSMAYRSQEAFRHKACPRIQLQRISSALLDIILMRGGGEECLIRTKSFISEISLSTSSMN